MGTALSRLDCHLRSRKPIQSSVPSGDGTPVPFAPRQLASYGVITTLPTTRRSAISRNARPVSASE
jgi:hypothetical protein